MFIVQAKFRRQQLSAGLNVDGIKCALVRVYMNVAVFFVCSILFFYVVVFYSCFAFVVCKIHFSLSMFQDLLHLRSLSEMAS